MDTFRQDLTYAVRMLARRPGFTFVAVVTLALGIAANTAIFSLIDGVLFRPLPYAQPDRLLNLYTVYPNSDGKPDIFSPPNYLDVATHSRTLAAVGASTDFSFTLSGDGQSVPEYLPGTLMTASMAQVLGVSPRVGRWFTAEEDDGNAAVAVISDALWKSRFGGDAQVLGRALQLNGRAFQVIGVLAPGVGYPTLVPQIYAPINFTPALKSESNRGNVFVNVAARLKDGSDLPAARAELESMAAAMSAQYPLDAGVKMGAMTLLESIVGNMRTTLLVLWAAVGFLLAVACANVANLLLTHAAGRQREFALRRSLGATGWRLARQLLTESVMLAALGGAAGLLLAVWAVPVMSANLPKSFPHVHDITMDTRVLLFTLAASLVTGTLFGLAPVLGAMRRDLAGTLRDSERGGQTGAQKRLGRVLAAGEVAAVLVLLTGAGLAMRSLLELSRVNPGFRGPGVIVWQLFLPSTRYPNQAAQRAFYDRVVGEVRSLPGVKSAALAQPLPFGPRDITSDANFMIAGQPPLPPNQRPVGLVARVSPEYFQAMNVPVLRGRAFTADDGPTSTVVVVSAALANTYFPGQDAVGQHLLLGSSRLDVQIIGVVGDVTHLNLRNAPRPEFYLPLARFTTGAAGLVVRTVSDSSAVSPEMMNALQQRVWQIDPALAGNLAAPMEELLHSSLAPERSLAGLLGTFAGVALTLGLIGVYGVLSYAVRQRTREIGIRLALGASQGEILRMVLGEAMRLAGAGVAVGAVAAVGLSRYVQTILFNVKALDFTTFAIVALTLPLAAMAAAYVPARRAAHVDPAQSLRAE